jgi:hypothetical protein
MMHLVMMMSCAGAGLVFEPGLEVVPLGALPGPVGALEVEVVGIVEPAGAGVSPPAAEVSADMERNQSREGSTARRRQVGDQRGRHRGVTSSGSRRQVHERAGKLSTTGEHYSGDYTVVRLHTPY